MLNCEFCYFQAEQFQVTTGKIRKKAEWKNRKTLIIIVIVVTVAVIVLILIILAASGVI